MRLPRGKKWALHLDVTGDGTGLKMEERADLLALAGGAIARLAVKAGFESLDDGLAGFGCEAGATVRAGLPPIVAVAEGCVELERGDVGKRCAEFFDEVEDKCRLGTGGEVKKSLVGIEPCGCDRLPGGAVEEGVGVAEESVEGVRCRVLATGPFDKPEVVTPGSKVEAGGPAFETAEFVEGGRLAKAGEKGGEVGGPWAADSVEDTVLGMEFVPSDEGCGTESAVWVHDVSSLAGAEAGCGVADRLEVAFEATVGGEKDATNTRREEVVDGWCREVDGAVDNEGLEGVARRRGNALALVPDFDAFAGYLEAGALGEDV